MAIRDEMQVIFIRLLFSQMMAEKLVLDQGMASLKTLVSLSDDNITVLFDITKWPVDVVSGRMIDRENEISIQAAKNLKLSWFMFKTN